MTSITTNNFLEIRDCEGESIMKGVPIYKIVKNTIYSPMGRFIIDGGTNAAGEETFTPLVDQDDCNPIHAVICKDNTSLKKGQLTYHDVSQMMANIFIKLEEDRKKFRYRTTQERMEYLTRDLYAIKVTRFATNNSLIHIFLDEYEKSVKSSMNDIENSKA